MEAESLSGEDPRVFAPAQPVAALTHLVGALVAACLVARLLRAGEASQRQQRALRVFAGVVLLQLTVSGIYHWLPLGSEPRTFFQRADHAAIWLTVFGCFLPVRHYLFAPRLGAVLQVAVLAMALAGILLETALHALIPSWTVVLLYVVFGSVGTPVAIWLVATRGLRYTLPFFLCGVSFTFAALIELAGEPALIPGWVEYHELVHVLVLCGFGFHWAFVAKLAREVASAQSLLDERGREDLVAADEPPELEAGEEREDLVAAGAAG